MSSIDRRRPRSALWRSVTACLLAALVAFAPVARAVCDLQHVATVGTGMSGCHTDGAADTHRDAPATCCDDGSPAMTPEARVAGDASAAASAAQPPAFLSHAFTPASAHATPIRGQHAPPPSEPAFRRVPKLLI
jgi:hypothetical protein